MPTASSEQIVHCSRNATRHAASKRKCHEGGKLVLVLTTNGAAAKVSYSIFVLADLCIISTSSFPILLKPEVFDLQRDKESVDVLSTLANQDLLLDLNYIITYNIMLEDLESSKFY